MKKFYEILNKLSQNRSQAITDHKCEMVLGHMANVEVFGGFWEANAELLEVLHQSIISEMQMEEDLSSEQMRLVKKAVTKSIMFFAECNALTKEINNTSQDK